MTENLATLIHKRGPIRAIGVIGMGYVGIPAAALFATCRTSNTSTASSGTRPRRVQIAMLNRGSRRSGRAGT